jgi:sugar lactone lactonase YvrE
VTQPRTVVPDLHFAEGPRWHDGRLWFSDFYSGLVQSVLEDGSDLRVEAEVSEQPSGAGWLPDGRMLVVSMKDQRILRREDDGSLVTHADLAGHAVGYLNDMCVDADGRLYVGSFGYDLMGGEPSAPASLFRVDTDGTVTEVADELWFPNGVVITEDRVLLVAETFGNRITAFDLTADGTLENRRTWAEFGPLPTEREFEKVLPQLVLAPDGTALDADGGLWVADAVGERLVRVVDGEIVQTLRPGSNVYACAVGGTDGRTLFACVAPDFFEHNRRPVREGRVVALPTVEA